MSALALVRRGKAGAVHVAAPARNGWQAACGRRFSGTLTVWRSRPMIRAVWTADDAPRCLQCSAAVASRTRRR